MADEMFGFSHVVLLVVPIMHAEDADDAGRQAVAWVKANYRKAAYQVEDRRTGERTTFTP